MKDQPLVSIIIPTYNRAHLIGETLDSIQAQTYKNWECIIVDDGSTDTTDEVVGDYVKKDSRFKYYHRPDEHLPGGNGARNYGFKMSVGEFVNWFDSDDLMTSCHLETHLSMHNKNNIDVSVTYYDTFIDTVDKGKETYKEIKSRLQSDKEVYYAYIEGAVNWGINGVFWNSDFLRKQKRKTQLFDERLVSGQDWTFHLYQLIKHKPLITTIHKVTNSLRYHNNKIGTLGGRQKINSLFLSTYIVRNCLIQENKLDATLERLLLKQMFASLKLSLLQGYPKDASKNRKILLTCFRNSFHKLDIIRVSMFSFYFVKVFGKGEVLFKI